MNRFALLDIDVDLNDRQGKKKPQTTENKKKPQPQSNKKKSPNNNDLLSMAFGSNKPSKNKRKGSAGIVELKGANGVEREEWKKHDEEYVRDSNEKSLREAMLLSKLDFEEKKTFYEQKKKEQLDDVKTGRKSNKKKDKPLTVSLDQFNNMRLGELRKDELPPKQVEPAKEENDTFFDDIEDDARKTLQRESLHEVYRATAAKDAQGSRYEAELEKRDFEIQALRLEVESLKEEMILVKTRNKKLCEVICQAEMKSKAELVVELDKIVKVREELTQEVTSLSQQLEQERSKVTQLSSDHKKGQGKRKHNTDSVSKE